MADSLNVDDIVYYFPTKQQGKVERVEALGLQNSVIILLDNGKRRLCIDQELRNVCKYFPLFIQSFVETKTLPDDIEPFSLAWLNVSPEQRLDLYKGLIAARASNKSTTIQTYLSKTLLKLSL